MKMKILFSLFPLLPIMVHAQSYITAVGVRMGTENGLTIQQRILERTTIEGIILSGFKSDYVSAALLIEKHHPLLFRNLNIYTGIGIQAKRLNQPENTIEIFTGAALVGGIELSLGKVNVSWDYKPVIYFDGPRTFQSESGLSIRYVFIRQQDIRKMKRNHRKKKRQRDRNKNKHKGLFNIKHTDK